MVVSCDACIVACSFTGSKQNNVQDVYTKCTCRMTKNTHTHTNTSSECQMWETMIRPSILCMWVCVCVMRRLKVSCCHYIHLKCHSMLGPLFRFFVSCSSVCVMRFRYTNISESDKCKLNTMPELDRMKTERENKMPKKSMAMAIAIRFSHKRKDTIILLTQLYWNRCNQLSKLDVNLSK